MNFEEALRDLDGRQSEAKPEPSLDRIRLVADLLDHPELTYPTIHVTGTNGKTTTTRMIAALGCAHGLTTGAFISPHVTSLTERLSVCGQDMTEEEFGEEDERLLPYFDQVGAVDGRRGTHFGARTSPAYVGFADKAAALGALRVGMGGTCDRPSL